MNMNLSDPADLRSADKNDDAAPDRWRHAWSRPCSGGEFDGTTSLKEIAEDAGLRGDGGEDREEAWLLWLQGLPHRTRRLQQPAERGLASRALAGRQRGRDRPEGLPHLDAGARGNPGDPRSQGLRPGCRLHPQRPPARLLRDRWIGADRSRRRAQVPAHRHPHQRVRRRAHDADVGLLLGPEDVAVGFSHSGSTTAVLEPLELARRQGADDRHHQLRRLAHSRHRRRGAVLHRPGRRSSARTRPRASCSSTSSTRSSSPWRNATSRPPNATSRAP